VASFIIFFFSILIAFDMKITMEGGKKRTPAMLFTPLPTVGWDDNIKILFQVISLMYSSYPVLSFYCMLSLNSDNNCNTFYYS
jgi:hypothetical protein